MPACLAFFFPTATSNSLQAFVVGVIVASGLYLLMLYRSGEFLVTEGFLLRIPFLFIVGLFFGYLVYVQKVGRDKIKAESEFTADLFEFGKALVQADDLSALYSKIPRLINEIMGTDACELALVGDGRITKRIFEGVDAEESPSLEVARSIHDSAYQSDDIFMSTTLGEDSEFSEKEDAQQYPYQGYMGKSWKPAGRPSGLIAVYRQTRNNWSSNDRKKFRFLADQTILGLQYVYVLKEMEKRSQNRRTDRIGQLPLFLRTSRGRVYSGQAAEQPAFPHSHGCGPLQGDQRQPWTCGRRPYFAASLFHTEGDRPPHGSRWKMWRG